MNDVELAVRRYNQGCSCSQAILQTYGELPAETAMRIATGFSGGMRMAKTCGAVTGAIMIIGLKFGQTRHEDTKAKQRTYELVNKLTERFRAIHGSVDCRDLLHCDISTPEGMKHARRNELFSTRCPQFVKDAAQILDQILTENS